jgi:anti-sigma B factor antagonist
VNIDLQLNRPQAVLVIAGELDIFSGARIIDAVASALDAGCVDVCMDLADVTFADSSGLTTVTRLVPALQERGGSLSIFGASHAFRRIATIVGVSETLGLQPIALAHVDP